MHVSMMTLKIACMVDFAMLGVAASDCVNSSVCLCTPACRGVSTVLTLPNRYRGEGETERAISQAPRIRKESVKSRFSSTFNCCLARHSHHNCHRRGE
ncbi:hypothetical protein BDV97DRAFT_341157 [Delphinella strobiligena]|nr:hypothetical protein BDV97DRAFT_341157 [Delphinella strobiligena]